MHLILTANLTFPCCHFEYFWMWGHLTWPGKLTRDDQDPIFEETLCKLSEMILPKYPTLYVATFQKPGKILTGLFKSPCWGEWNTLGAWYDNKNCNRTVVVSAK